MDKPEFLKGKNGKHLGAIMGICKALSSTLDLREVLQLVMHRVGELFEVKHRALLLIDVDTDELYYEMLSGPDAEDLRRKRLLKGEGPAGLAALHGETVFVEDSCADARFAGGCALSPLDKLPSGFYAPIRYKNHVVGVFELADDEPERLRCEESRAVLSAIADLVAVAVDSARSYSRIQHLVIIDELTGLYNSAYLLDFLDYEIERASRYRTPLSLIFLDMDYFKEINDTHGHLAGSQLLTEVGQLIKGNVRKADMAARYGGDEFVLVLPNTPKPGAEIVAENLRRGIEENEFLGSRGLKVKVTASFGLSALPEDGDSKLKLLQLADKAMYKAKEEGRNKVVKT